jgi:hypothetical protein
MSSRSAAENPARYSRELFMVRPARGDVEPVRCGDRRGGARGSEPPCALRCADLLIRAGALLAELGATGRIAMSCSCFPARGPATRRATV